MPKVSIIVPVYKVEKYIRRCLDSIVSQTFTDWECLLIDDGSPDNSGKICDEYAEKDTRFIVFHKENGGVSSARNYALDNAHGEYVMFVDSDDWIEKDCLVVCVMEADEYKLDLLQFSSERVNERGKKYRAQILGCEACNHSQYLELCKLCVTVWGGLYRRKIIEDNHISFIDGLKLAEDQLFVFNFIVRANNLKSITNCFYNYYINDESATHHQKTDDILKSIQYLQIFCNDHPEFMKVTQNAIQTFMVDIMVNHDLEQKEYYSLFNTCTLEQYDRQLCRIYRKIAKISSSFAYWLVGNIYRATNKSLQ